MTPIEAIQTEIDRLDREPLRGPIHLRQINIHMAALELALADAELKALDRFCGYCDSCKALANNAADARTHLYSLLTKGE